MVRSLVWGAVVWGGLGALATTVYASLVLGPTALWASEGLHLPLSIFATGLVAIAFRPAKESLRRAASRLLYGHRQTPVASIAELSQRLAEAVQVEETLPEIARILAYGTGAKKAQLWLRTGQELAPLATWPSNGDGHYRLSLSGEELPAIPEADLAIPVFDGGEILGVLSITKRPSEPVTGVERELMMDLASQAALALRNARLTAELDASLKQLSSLADRLRHSRRRLVEAQDAERRRIERELHDEAQQYLLALVIQLERARQALNGSPDRIVDLIEEVARLHTEVVGILDRFSTGLSAPELRERGLVATLGDHIDRLNLPVELQVGEVERYSPDIEEAAYFVCLEAVQNAVKHARASQIELSLYEEEGYLRLMVIDDGLGFDSSATQPGSGMAGMNQRLEEHGGNVGVFSRPGEGTRVEAVIPVGVREEVLK